MKKIHTYGRAIVFLVIVQYCIVIGYASDEAGCFHNGTQWHNGSLVPSLEPCLSCKCVDSHLRCSLRVCPEQPIPPPRGCVLVQKKLSCCPHVSCKKYHNENDNGNRRVVTYNSNWPNNDSDGDVVDERQKVTSKNSLYRRIEDEEEINGNDQMCVHNGTIYRTGSAMSTSSLCSYCYCIGGKQKCVRPKCLLTSPGCVPVFIDSSCCPIRYDCGVVGADSSSSLPTRSNYYRIENKHYNRMRSRAQRNRGCLVASTYYPEGEKLPNDVENPCDICFCIRGIKKCTPKKCAPYIGNCKPKIPEGQCCPANYECDHSDETPSHRPRQFDLFSYFFSDEATSENDANTEPSDQPYTPTTEHSSSISSTSEKSFFDAIRDGLNYIDSNDEHVEKILDAPALDVNTSTITDRPLHRNTTELSFLDILLSDDDDDDEEDSEEPLVHTDAFPNFNRLPNFNQPADGATIYASDLTKDDLDHDRYYLLDEQSAHETAMPTVTANSVTHSESTPTAKTSNYDRSATERIISEYITYTPVPNYNFETSTLSANMKDFDTSTSMETAAPSRHETTNTFDEEITTDNPTSDDETVSETTSSEIEGSTKLQTTTANSRDDNNETSEIITTTEPSLVSAFFEEFSHLFGDKNSLIEKHAIKSRPEEISTLNSAIVNIGGPTQSSTQSPSIPKTTRRVTPTILPSPASPHVTHPPLIVTITPPTTKMYSTSPTTTTTTPYTQPSKSPSTFQLHTSTTKFRETTTSVPSTTTSPSTTLSQPLNLTVTSPKVVQLTHSTDANTHEPTTTKIIQTTTSEPSLIDSNPSILDSDLNYDYGDQPTLPPSLPNLKIIPFLPADAVRKDSVIVHPKLEYYSTSYPVLTENYENPYLTSDHLQNQNADFTAFEVEESEAKDSFSHKNDNSDFNSYSVESTGYSNDAIFGIPNTNSQSPDYSQYPSITSENPNVDQVIISKYPAYSKYNIDYDYEAFNSEKHADNNKYAPGSYESLDGHEYSVQSRNPSFDQFATDYPERQVYSKIEYQFSTSNPLYGYNGNNKFSPPSKTEGGFLPKEPLDNGDQYYDKLQTTKYRPDITAEPSLKPNTTGQLIGITSEDPFKNVIRTEPPPNLLTLIEDKEKLFHTVPELSTIDRDYPSIHLSDIEKEIISITTDTNYNPSPEYALDPLADDFFHNDTNDYSHNATGDGEKPTNSTTKYSTEVSVSSNFQPNPTQDPEQKDFLGSLLGYIFKDNHQDPEPTESSLLQETPTIPPFKKISSTSLSLKDILNFTKPVESSSKKVDIPQRKNNKIYEYPTTTAEAVEETSTPRVENFNILRDVLLATLNTPSNIDHISHRNSHPTIDVPKPIYSSHSIHQFLNPIFAGNSELTHATSKYSPINPDIDLTIPKLNSQIDDNKDELNNNVFGPDSYQVLNDYPSLSNNRPFGGNPIDYDALKEHHSTDEHSPGVYTQPLNSFQNSMGILKLAGCNIYGRMYRVGRIITELSNPCLECKCTEVGVHCTTLSC